MAMMMGRSLQVGSLHGLAADAICNREGRGRLVRGDSSGTQADTM